MFETLRLRILDIDASVLPPIVPARSLSRNRFHVYNICLYFLQGRHHVAADPARHVGGPRDPGRARRDAEADALLQDEGGTGKDIIKLK